MDNEGFVYAIRQVNGGPTKLGKAVDVQLRLCSLQTGNPIQLEIIWTYGPCDMTATEGRLHEWFKSRRLRGEWFELSFAEIRRLTTIVKSVVPYSAPVELKAKNDASAGNNNRCLDCAMVRQDLSTFPMISSGSVRNGDDSTRQELDAPGICERCRKERRRVITLSLAPAEDR